MVSDVITALGNVDFTIDSDAVTARFLDDLPQSIETAKLPMRVIRLQTEASSINQIAYLTCKTSVIQNVEWKIRDQLLFQPDAQTTGLGYIDPLLTQYCQDYVLAMAQQFTQPTADSELLGVEITAGMFEYPLGSGQFYHGAQSVVSVIEHLI